MQALVQLNAVGGSKSRPGDAHRSFILHSADASIDVGRASKHVTKGLKAKDDNANFESPIMSRQHATITANLKELRIYVRDCKSTHGTYFGTRRLNQEEDYLLKNDQIITFGTKVTNGLDVYSPKSFRITFQWEPQTIHTKSLDDPIEPSRPGFRVPDVESSPSEDPRENSVEVLSSNPRAFSVPSSDDESDFDGDDNMEVSSSVQGPNLENSVVTTPESQASNGSVGMSEHGKNAPPATSDRDLSTSLAILYRLQNSPMHLKSNVTDNLPTFNTDSEDELPEVLPIHPSKASGIRAFLNDSPPLLSQRQQTISLEPESIVEDNGLSWGNSNTNLCPADEYKSSKTCASNIKKTRQPHEIGDAFCCAEGAARAAKVANERSGSMNTTNGEEEDDDDENFYFRVDQGQGLDDSSSDATRHSQDPTIQVAKASEALHEVLPSAGSHQVEPKPVLSHVFHVSESSPIDISMAAQESHKTHPRAPSPSDAALAKNVGTYRQNETALENDRLDPATQITSTSPQGLSAAKEPFGPSKNTGNWTPHELDSFKFVRPKALYSKPMNPNSAIPASSDSDMTGQDARGHRTTTTGDHGRVLKSSSNREFVDRNSRSSRLDIENLINDGPGNNSNFSESRESRSLKRKANLVFSEAEGCEPATESAQSGQARLSVTSQTDTLHDAQDREPILDFDDSIALEESKAPDTLVSGPCQQEGSARKKLKTSPSSSRGIGRFVSGVCVGVAGVIAAGAALIATIPADVHEEALREVLTAL